MKYGLLFIGLTFLAVGSVEVLRQLRVHPIQYLLVGCAVSIFFLLLLSLSENLRFDQVRLDPACSRCACSAATFSHCALSVARLAYVFTLNKPR